MKAKAKRKAQRKAESATFDARDYLKKGDVVYNSWGYDQTNVDYYVVHNVTRKFVMLAPCGAEVVNSSGGISPKTSSANTAKLERHGVYAWRDTVSVNFRHGAGSKWDGRPKYATPANAGH